MYDSIIWMRCWGGRSSPACGEDQIALADRLGHSAIGLMAFLPKITPPGVILPLRRRGSKSFIAGYAISAGQLSARGMAFKLCLNSPQFRQVFFKLWVHLGGTKHTGFEK